MYYDWDCSNHDTGNCVSDHFRWANFGVFGQFLLIIKVNEWFYRISFGAQFCCPINCECTDRFIIDFEQAFAKKKSFFICTTQKAPFCLCQLRPNFWKWPEQGATPGQNFHGTNHLACLPRFQVPGVTGPEVILLRRNTNFFQIFSSSSLGSKKMRFVHTTELASECMWKAHKLAVKMSCSAF